MVYASLLTTVTASLTVLTWVKMLKKLQGYGFPISDIAGNMWIGCEAIKHSVNVQEGIESESMLADRIFALFNNDLNFLAECITRTPLATYGKASGIVKALINEDNKSYEIVKKSAMLLLNRLNLLDERLQLKLPIIVTGELTGLYSPFFQNKRFNVKPQNFKIALVNYGIKRLKSQPNY